MRPTPPSSPVDVGGARPGWLLVPPAPPPAQHTRAALRIIRSWLRWLRWLAIVPIVPAIQVLFFGLMWGAPVLLVAGLVLLALSSLIWMLFDRD
jgi:hypothetical protein